MSCRGGFVSFVMLLAVCETACDDDDPPGDEPFTWRTLSTTLSSVRDIALVDGGIYVAARDDGFFWWQATADSLDRCGPPDSVLSPSYASALSVERCGSRVLFGIARGARPRPALFSAVLDEHGRAGSTVPATLEARDIRAIVGRPDGRLVALSAGDGDFFSSTCGESWQPGTLGRFPGQLDATAQGSDVYLYGDGNIGTPTAYRGRPVAAGGYSWTFLDGILDLRLGYGILGVADLQTPDGIRTLVVVDGQEGGLYILPAGTGAPERIYRLSLIRGSDDLSLLAVAADSLYFLREPSMAGAFALPLPEGHGHLVKFDIDWETRSVAVATRVSQSDPIQLHVGGPLPAELY
jgi:hypothetical protein